MEKLWSIIFQNGSDSLHPTTKKEIKGKQEEIELKKMINKYQQLFNQFNNIRSKINKEDNNRMTIIARKTMIRNSNNLLEGLNDSGIKINEKENKISQIGRAHV